MDANSLIRMIENNPDEYHQDIIFIKNRMIVLLEKEDYKSLPIIHRWLEELLVVHHDIKVK